MARRLADMAMEMAEDVLQNSKTPPERGATKPDHTVRFERISRTVRRAILLARKLAEPLPQPRPVRAPAPAPALDSAAARKRIIRKVEDAIYRKSRHEVLDTAALEAELLDRLDRPDLEDDIASRPLDEIIADIARDLGVGFPLDKDSCVGKRRTPEDIAKLEARATVRPQRPPWAKPRNTPSQGPPHPNGPQPPQPSV